jgi:RHS repeat-associated protein
LDRFLSIQAIAIKVPALLHSLRVVERIGESHMLRTSSSFYRHLVSVLSAFAFIAPALLAGQMASAPKSKVPLAMVLGQPRSIQVAKPFGMLTDSIPIIVPPGRRDVEPHMQLTYSSGGENGILGLGWDLNLGYVELNRRNGLPASGEMDTYNFSIAGLSGELHNDGTGVYHSRTELVYREFRKTSAGGWEMRDGQGNRYLFGSSSKSQISGALWLLDTVTDPSGNQILYNYLQDQGAFYPSTITYTGYNGAPGPNTVKFSYEARPDVRNTFAHGVSETRAMRMTAIDANFGTLNFLAQRYRFTYTQTSSGQSVVQRIDLIGADGTSTIPLRVMSYSIFAKGWSQTSSASIATGFVEPDNGADLGERLVDFNGDGCTDTIISAGVVNLGNCDGTFGTPNDQAWTNAIRNVVQMPEIVKTVSIGTKGDLTTADQGIRFLDVNGDGRPDIVIFNSSLGRIEVWLNTFDGINTSTIGFAKANWTFPLSELSYNPLTGKTNCPTARTDPFPFTLVYTGTDNNGNSVPGAPAGVMFADVNGDGLPDVVWSMRQDTGNGTYCIAAVYLNTGGGWTRNQPLSDSLLALGPYSINNTAPLGLDFVDINGDGKADIIFTPASGNSFVCMFTGSGWQSLPCNSNYSTTLHSTLLTSVDFDGTPTGLQYVDYDHDGLTDIVLVNAATPIKVFHNTGQGFAEDTGMETYWGALPPFVGTVGNNSHAQTASLTDINGDGVLDLVSFTDGNIYLGGVCPPKTLGCIITNSGRVLPEGMLLQSFGPLGEDANFAWDRAPSSLPLPLFVPIAVNRTENRSDSKTPAATTKYTYIGGTYSDRKFMGFSLVNEFQPNGNRVVTQYVQQELFVGQESSVAIVDANNFERYSKTNVFAAVTPQVSPEIQQGVLVSTDETFYDPTAGGSASYTAHVGNLSYDDRLNPMFIYRNPNTSVAGLDSTTSHNYARNDNAAIWNLPASINVFRGTTSTPMSRTYFYYDNQPQFTATRGLLTSEQEEIVELPTPKLITRNSTYDQYGNVLSVTDGNGNTSSWVYDTATSTFRVSAKDQAGHTVQSTFDPKWGSVLTDTDASGNTTTSQYDAFGRLQEVVKPGDQNLGGGTTAYLYSVLPVGGTGFNVTRFDSTTSGATRLQSVDYFDSFGQIYMTTRSGPGGKTIVMTTDYDDMSLPIRLSRPYFSGDTAYYTTLTRDPMHRITNILDADGLSTARSYAALQVTETDRRGLTTVTVMNPAQQVTKKVLPTATGNATTTYVYDPLNRLTQVVRADGSKTTMTYDMLGRKTSITDPNTGIFHYVYDNEGHIKTITDPNGQKTQYAYDRTGNLISRTYPDGTKNTVMYGEAAQTNAMGRMVAVNDAAGTLLIAYDTRGRVTQHSRTVLANGKTYVTKYAYDSADRLVTLTYPDGFTVKYAYDLSGNVLSVTDGGGHNVANNFAYTASGRLTGLTFGNGAHSAYTYDVLDRMLNLQTLRPDSSAMQNLGYNYDADSNVATIQDALNGFNQQFSYDPMNRLISANGVGYGTENYTYDAIGNLLTKGTSSFVMDPLHPERATCMMINAKDLYPNPATACGAFGTTAINYDARGNVVQIGSQQYTYDFENRLVAEGDGTSTTESNVYDFWGDRVVQTTPTETRVFIDDIYEDGANGISEHVKTPNLLLMTILKPPAALASNVAKVTKPTLMATIQRLRVQPVGAVPLLALLLGLTFFAMLFGSALRINGSGRGLRVRFGMPRVWRMQPRTGLIVLALVFTLISPGTTDSMAMASPIPTPVASPHTAAPPPATAQRYYYHMNHLGGVNLISDSTATIIALREYKPFGETNSGGGSITPSFAFDGQRPDGTNATTGLYYFNARFYSPQLGRFLSADSVMERPTTPQALNRYAFAGGNPLRYVDPSGHSWYDFVIAAAIFTAIIVFAALSGGAGLAVIALAAGAVGLGVGAAVAAGQGYSITDANFWNIALTGALIGAAVGSGFGQIAIEGGEAEAADAGAQEAESAAESSETASPASSGARARAAIRPYISDALKSMAFGGPQAVMIHELNGGSTDSLLRDTWEGVATSAATGVIMGRVSGALRSSDALEVPAIWSFKIGITRTILIQGALWTFAGVEKQSVGHWAVGETGLLPGSKGPAIVGYRGAQAYSSNGYNPRLADPTPY